MNDKKKWLPIHDICIKYLLRKTIDPGRVKHLAEIFVEGAAVPQKDISKLMAAFTEALTTIKASFGGTAEVELAVKMAANTLEQQLEESKKKCTKRK